MSSSEQPTRVIEVRDSSPREGTSSTAAKGEPAPKARESRSGKEAKDSKDSKDRKEGTEAKESKKSSKENKVAPQAPAPRVHARPGGLSEDILTQVAQAKFEAQEDKLRDIVRHSMALLRDIHKSSEVDVARKETEIRRALLRYEMQNIKVAELQERRREKEIQELNQHAEQCRKEAETEADKTVELRNACAKEWRRRKRYETYESQAAEVNKKKTRTGLNTDIDTLNADIKRLGQQRDDLEVAIEKRHQRSQLFRQAAAELCCDLRQEREMLGDALGSSSVQATPSPVEQPSNGKPAGGKTASTPVEVIS